MYVTTEKELNQVCDSLKDCQWLAIDTEFVREKTYFHRLGLIQVSGNGICAAIDPIQIKNIDPFLSLITHPKITKVFHAGKQDLEIFYRLCDKEIKPVFDTQVAASLVGWGAQISFAKLVMKVTGKKIHKAETYSDWCRRPLSKSQIAYALDDVRYLAPVYEKLLEQLEKLNRLDWLHREFEALENPDNYRLPDPRKQYLKVKNVRMLKPRNLAVMVELAAWREKEAIARDCLSKAILRDEPLLEIARLLPKKVEKMNSIRGINHREISRSGDQILKLIEKGLSVSPDKIPKLPETKNYSTRPGVEELLAAYVQLRSEELKIEPYMLADRKLIHQFVKCYEQNRNMEENLLFQGWRKDLIGKSLLSILDGEIGIGIGKNGNVRLIKVHP